MSLTVCTEPQCLYKDDPYLYVESWHRSTKKHEVSVWRVVITAIFRYISQPQLYFSPQFTLLRLSMNTNSSGVICIKYLKISFTSTTKSEHHVVFPWTELATGKIPVVMNSQTRDSWSQQHGMMDLGRNVPVCRDKLDQVPVGASSSIMKVTARSDGKFPRSIERNSLCQNIT